jgi:hypothetical protein
MQACPFDERCGLCAGITWAGNTVIGMGSHASKTRSTPWWRQKKPVPDTSFNTGNGFIYGSCFKLIPSTRHHAAPDALLTLNW